MVPPTVSPRTAASRAFAGRIVSAIDAHPAGIPVVLGGCGTGRTSMLRSLQEHYGDRSCQYIDVERAATTPERFARAIASGSPFVAAGQDREARSPRDAFDQTLSFLATARRGDGGPAMFLLDEALELRTFESFPAVPLTSC
jgi:Cdc6-like AAA superfamily ATPase